MLLLIGLLACSTPAAVDAATGLPSADSAAGGSDSAAGGSDSAAGGSDSAAGGADTVDSGPPPDTGGAPDAQSAPLCINEFMPDNASALLTESGDSPDWIELHNPSELDVSLAGWALSDDAELSEPLSEALAIPAGGFLLLYADGAPELGPDHLDFRLDAAGGEVALLAPDGGGQVLRYGSIEADFSAARETDCCEGSGCWGFAFRGTPGVSNTPPVLVSEVLLPGGSDWRYEDSNTALAEGWREPGYDDSGWASGPAPLGFGDTHQITLVESGAADARTSTIYFRAGFEVADSAAVSALSLSLMLDDGAVVWLNGQEALRVNITAGEITHDTLATTAVGDVAEYTFYDYPADTALLVEGLNTLAIEVHQASANSSDMTLDLAVTAEVEETP